MNLTVGEIYLLFLGVVLLYSGWNLKKNPLPTLLLWSVGLFVSAGIFVSSIASLSLLWIAAFSPFGFGPLVLLAAVPFIGGSFMACRGLWTSRPQVGWTRWRFLFVIFFIGFSSYAAVASTVANYQSRLVECTASVVDQNGQPVAGVKVATEKSIGIIHRHNEDVTDQDGQFKIRHEPGHLVMVKHIEKQGYDCNPRNWGNNGDVIVTASNSPVFKVRKKEPPTVVEEQGMGRTSLNGWEGELSGIDVKRGVIRGLKQRWDTDEHKDIIFSYSVSDQDNAITVNFEVPDKENGIIASNDKLYVSPETGYQSNCKILIKKGDNFTVYYYVKSREGSLYSRLEIHYYYYSDGSYAGFEGNRATNLVGERNLEYNKEMTDQYWANWKKETDQREREKMDREKKEIELRNAQSANQPIRKAPDQLKLFDADWFASCIYFEPPEGYSAVFRQRGAESAMYYRVRHAKYSKGKVDPEDKTGMITLTVIDREAEPFFQSTDTLLKNFSPYDSVKIGKLAGRKAVVWTNNRLSQTLPEAQQSSGDFIKFYQVVGNDVFFEARIEAWTSEQLRYLDSFVRKIKLKF